MRDRPARVPVRVVAGRVALDSVEREIAALRYVGGAVAVACGDAPAFDGSSSAGTGWLRVSRPSSPRNSRVGVAAPGWSVPAHQVRAGRTSYDLGADLRPVVAVRPGIRHSTCLRERSRLCIDTCRHERLSPVPEHDDVTRVDVRPGGLDQPEVVAGPRRPGQVLCRDVREYCDCGSSFGRAGVSSADPIQNTPHRFVCARLSRRGSRR